MTLKKVQCDVMAIVHPFLGHGHNGNTNRVSSHDMRFIFALVDNRGFF